VNRLLEQLDPGNRDRLRSRGMPKWISPMLATLTEDYFSDDAWIFERKLDGERCLAFHDGRGTRLRSRNRQRLDDTYPELVDALGRQGDARFVVDGEIVAFEGNRTSFARLQDRMRISDPEQARRSKVKVYFYLFDLLHLDGYDLTAAPLRARKQVLRQLLDYKGPLRFTAHRNGSGEQYHREACRKGWEGLIAKKADSSYAHSRSRDWLKFKCTRRQELVVGGYTDPQGSRIGFGALLLGVYEGRTLHYAGKVGTGFDDETLQDLGKRLRQHESDDCPFAEPDEASGRGVHWVAPKLVAEIGFTEWTGDGRLRHPRFVGLRRDKRPREAVREQPSGG